jgi:hypothetical protein
MAQAPVDVPTIPGLAVADGVAAALIIWAMRYPVIWEVIGNGPGVDPRMMSAEGKAELRAQLGEIQSALMAKVKDGDLPASVFVTKVAAQRAMLI